jgi:hypothetical protein
MAAVSGVSSAVSVGGGSVTEGSAARRSWRISFSVVP